MLQNVNRTQDMPENRPMFGNGPLTHESVYDHQILLIFIPWSWWWSFSNVDNWQKLPMKLDIVYMDTISLIEFSLHRV